MEPKRRRWNFQYSWLQEGPVSDGVLPGELGSSHSGSGACGLLRVSTLGVPLVSDIGQRLGFCLLMVSTNGKVLVYSQTNSLMVPTMPLQFIFVVPLTLR